MSVGSLEPQFAAAFLKAIGRPELAPEGIAPKEINRDKAEVRKIFKSKTRDEWTEIFRGVDACVEPVLTFAEAMKSGHAQSRQMVIDIPLADGGTAKQMANPIKFSKTTQAYTCAGVPSGAHTKEILLRLGYTEEEYRKFNEEGVID